MSSIKIISPPDRDSPIDRRKELVGLVIPLPDPMQLELNPPSQRELVSKKEGDYVVRLSDVTTALRRKRMMSSARYWTLDYLINYLVINKEACVLVE